MGDFRKGLWVEVLGGSSPVRSPLELSKMLRFASRFKVHDLYFQVFRSGLSWFHRGGLSCALQTDFDPLASLLKEASLLGIRVHAWINVFRVGDEFAEGFASEFGSTEFLTSSEGVSLQSYENLRLWTKQNFKQGELDTPGAWLRPDSEPTQEFYRECIEILLREYPSLSGIHLDYFRYPYVLPMAPSEEHPDALVFGQGDAHSKRKSLTDFLTVIRTIVSPNQLLSVAAVPWVERAYLQAYQDWPGWLEQGLVDHICLMSYSADRYRYELILKQALGCARDGSQIVAGIGSFYLRNWKDIEEQANCAAALNLRGCSIFSYRNLKKGGLIQEGVSKE